jgi:hypothetical protein
MGNTRLALKVEVKPGNETSSNHSTAGLWQLLESIPKRYWPAFIRGDVAETTDRNFETKESFARRNEPGNKERTILQRTIGERKRTKEASCQNARHKYLGRDEK